MFVASTGAAAQPFSVTDRYPVARIFAPPAPTSADGFAAEGLAWSLTADWSTSATLSTKTTEALVLDGESVALTARWTLQRSGWRVGVDAPFNYQSGGVLDQFIDEFHELFDFPEGDRPQLPRDDLRYAYQRDGVRLLDVNGHSSGLGDIALHVGRAWREDAHSSLAWRAHLRLPTGSTSRLLGSGAVGVGASVNGARRYEWRARPLRWYGGLGAQWHSDADVLRAIQNQLVWFGHGGVQWGMSPSITLRAQLDAHGAYFDSDLRGLREALALTLGGDYRFASGWRLTLAIVEDVAPRTVPDVVFHFGLRRD